MPSPGEHVDNGEEVPMEMIHWLGDPECHDARIVGPKAANLSRLAALHRVPPGFAITADAAALGAAALAAAVAEAYGALSGRHGAIDHPVAVRSSAIDEDGNGASFAGQHDTYLNMRGREAVLDAVTRCVESASTPDALAYRRQHGLATHETKIAVLVQALVSSDVSAVVFSVNPVNGSRDEVLINASWGLGESVVGGTVTPDTYVVERATLRVSSRVVTRKARMTVLEAQGTREVAVPRFMSEAPCLTDDEAIEMARLALGLESHFGWHADIECAFAAGDLYLLQCRPITALR
ncbi:MAG: hypothetical protein C0506_15320 [Anaerolinea sp.]|nr:hypothetical protein [Anaerolinea sp.]